MVPIFAGNTSFAALRGPERDLGVLTFLVRGLSDPSLHRRRNRRRGPHPDIVRRAYARRPPHRKRWGPGVLREARTADGPTETWSPQMNARSAVPRR